MPDSEKIAAIRQMLPATAAGIYLNAGTCGPLPAETMRAMDEQAASELAVGRAKVDQFVAFLDRMAEARAAVAALLVADPDDIALTHSTTDGINLVLSSLTWTPGDRVVTTNHEHPGVLGPLQALRDRYGVQVEFVDIGDGGDDELTLAGVRRALERPARAVVASHVLWTTGAVLPVGALGTLARHAGAVSLIDGAQSAGAIPVALDELDVDAYAVPGQKWLLGPEGMGALWVRRAFADATIPAIAGYLAYSSFEKDKGGTLRDGARRFEATGFHRPSVIGLARSVGWLTMYVGFNWALERAARLAASAYERLAGIPGVRMVTPPDHGGTLVTFRIEGWTAAAAVGELGPRVFAIIRDLPPIDAIRISVGFWNTEEELERFAAAVELLAGHTPETIPPRRTLTVLGSDDQPLA
ncbi:MAG: Aminotransferase class V-fold PLP-dependent enzyme [Chloroflexota bacterium]|nr:Aminotransferase class V-fold PLP-dependent enzyme [Chloroflexota bacterium]